jgi:hypothetical protein
MRPPIRTITRAALTAAACAALAPAVAAHASPAGPRVVEAFESSAPWTANPASGVDLRLSADAGATGRALRLDFDFHGGGGYAVARRALDLALPPNYRFTFKVRGRCRPQNLEFKLVDASGDNVWWVNTRDFAFSPDWTTVTVKKRHISFAWGPRGGGELDRVAALEFAVTAGAGGAGTVWIDELAIEELPVVDPEPPAPRASATSSVPGSGPERAVDGDPATAWASRPGSRGALELDLGTEREFGGLVLDWVAGRHATDYVVETRGSRGPWQVVRTVTGGNGGRDPLDLPESEARRVRVRVLRAAAPDGAVALAGAELQPLAWGADAGAFFAAVARDAPRGRYPRGITGEQSYWTVAGVDGAREETLVDEDGRVETGKASFSVEPFLWMDGRLVGWADVLTEPALVGGDLPIPTVRWRSAPLELTVTVFVEGPRDASVAVARYAVRNVGSERVKGRLFLALRPFQVNPPPQFLNMPGGVAQIGSLALSNGRGVRVDGGRGVVGMQEPSAFGATAFDRGDVSDFLAAGEVPPATSAQDPYGRASGALAYDLDLLPGRMREVGLWIPLARVPEALDSLEARRTVPDLDLRQHAVERTWRAALSRVRVDVPDSAVAAALRAQLGWILVNRDGPAIQPGSRSYERSWIRDGSLTSTALLQLGHAEVVREFLTWFAPFQYADGKVPCCVDARGADPVPEHDSHGELIYLAAEHLRLTGDRATAASLWPHVRAAAGHLDALRAQRRTQEWRAPGREEFFGILPPSISHEGYSAKPMHSYWDALFALRGYKDAAWMAAELGHSGDADRIAASRDTFAADLAASIRAAMARHGIDHVPGCADLGDFDATSTTIALSPVQAAELMPPGALERTFERYWMFFAERRDGVTPWDAFTPYEWRNVGAMARLGWRERAGEALAWLMAQRRPPGFQHWAEVVDHDPRRARFIGDMPHTWCGSDFVRSVVDMIAWERESDGTIVIGSGLPEVWLRGTAGVGVKGLVTRWGALETRVREYGAGWEARVESTVAPPGGAVVWLPGVVADGTWEASVNGADAVISADGSVRAPLLPATVVVQRRAAPAGPRRAR